MPVAAAIPFVVGGVGIASAVQGYNANKRAADDTLTASTNLANQQIAVSERNAAAIQDVAKANAAAAGAVAAYNTRVAQADAAQVAIDSATNVRAMRRDASVYLSRQRAAYAGSGVKVDSGSPLAVRIATAGRLALREAEATREAGARSEGILQANRAAGVQSKAAADLSLYEAGKRADITREEGRLTAQGTLTQGRGQADAYRASGTASVLNGAARVLSTGYDFYQGGAFDFGGSKT